MVARVIATADRCFKASGRCTTTVDGSVTCWKTGARREVAFGPYQTRVTYTRRRKLCLTRTLTPTEFGWDDGVTRGSRTWHYRPTRDGVEVVCPNGKSEVYTSDDFSRPACRPKPADLKQEHCQIGTCP
jgi:hypothetical protein